MWRSLLEPENVRPRRGNSTASIWGLPMSCTTPETNSPCVHARTCERSSNCKAQRATAQAQDSRGDLSKSTSMLPRKWLPLISACINLSTCFSSSSLPLKSRPILSTDVRPPSAKFTTKAFGFEACRRATGFIFPTSRCGCARQKWKVSNKQSGKAPFKKRHGTSTDSPLESSCTISSDGRRVNGRSESDVSDLRFVVRTSCES
mmetsp:Transcript_51720/g.168054  ORF Transcript_51720/g.168054 Transcript_51720/m.168054 type:complete len:204 (+) Transcript_51720:8288-8899(+)